MLRIRILPTLLFINLFLFLFSHAAFAAPQTTTQSVAGDWVTFDSKTKKPSSVIQISQKGPVFSGKIIKTFSVPVEKKADVCTSCHGNQKNKPIIGLEIIKNMVCNDNGYCHQGTITDPRDGRVYHATLQLIKGGTYLKVHGYVGIALFGKTVVWKRFATQ